MEHAKTCQRPISLERRLAATYLVAGLVTAGLAGCAAGPDFQRPTAPDVARYTATPVADRTASSPTQFGEAQRLVEGLPIETQWWQSLDSSAVDGLIDEAFHVSPTLASISANLRQAQELLAAQRRRKIMLLLGAETLGMTHNQCLELLESSRRYTRLPDLQPDLPDPCGEPAGSTRCGPNRRVGRLGSGGVRGAAYAAGFGCGNLSAGHRDLCSAQPRAAPGC